MTDSIEFLLTGVVMGIAGSALIDGWALLLRRTLHVSTLDYAMLGRWIGHFPQGRFVHERIGAAAPVRGERPLGWVAHYSIGVVFAFVLLGLWGLDWARSPTIGPALLVGVGTVLAPWLVMQPAFGAGIAGSKTPNPRAGRLRNLSTHLVFGVGLYLAALALSLA